MKIVHYFIKFIVWLIQPSDFEEGMDDAKQDSLAKEWEVFHKGLRLPIFVRWVLWGCVYVIVGVIAIGVFTSLYRMSL